VTATGWLAAAGALVLLGLRGAPSRVQRLTANGRLGAARSSDEVRTAAPRPQRWSPTARRRDLRGALAALAGELAAGGRPDAALTAAAAAGPAHAASFARAAATAAGGGDVAEVLRRDPDVAGLAAAWTLADQAGAPLAAVVERVAADLDAVEEQRRAVAVALAGPRSSAAVLAGLPALGLLLGTTMGGRPLAFLAGSPGGFAVGAAGLVLDLLGLWWMRRILRWASR